MLVSEIMTSGVEMIDAEATLADAAQQMASLDVGGLPVWQNDRLVGMITDRDITIRAIAQGKNPLTTRVSEVMTPEVFHCSQNANVHEAAIMMEEKSIHRLLVVDSDHRPVGFLSLADVALKTRDEHLSWEILERICEPASPHR
jgi:CBS domain-containing protein